MKIEFDKVERNGMIAVLVSPGFGAGWSTWAGEELTNFAAMDSGLVAMAERDAPVSEVEEYIKKKTGDEYFYTGGWPVAVEWIPTGSAFRIDEYDGSETLISDDERTMLA